MAPPRLLALDMDGTLLRPGGGVDPRDVAAIRRARDAGVTVTIATGRVSTGTLPTARELGLKAPLVCADGALMVCPRTGTRLEHTPIALDVAEASVRTLCAHDLAPFVITHDAIHGDESGREHAGWITVWTEDLTLHPCLPDASAWRRPGEITMAVGVGPRERVEAAREILSREHGSALEAVHFGVSLAQARGRDLCALLCRPRGVSKGAALARLAARLGVAREQVAAVGDWYNDISMFEWAGRSFAMGQSPTAVRAVATDVLEATHVTGGGIAEAIERWLR